MHSFLHPSDVDQLLQWPRGRTMRLARLGRFPAVLLPGGEYRVRREDLEALVRKGHTMPDAFDEVGTPSTPRTTDV